ncbi:MAG TPA: peptidoglycan DD-metalloendopeptidase family protein [Sphingomonas sp.]|jgi:murein DD-endopeptidase MepM/ murein hydrolase activator NlpD
MPTDQGLELAGGGSRTFGRGFAPVAPAMHPLSDRLLAVDWVPDLGAQIGTRDWWRGAATCLSLCAAAIALSPAGLAPGWQAIPGATSAPLAGAAWDETRAQGIAPLAWGADTGRRMAANDLVAPLAEVPERPLVELSATLGEGDAFDRALVRAGVGRTDARAAAALVADTVRLGDIAQGTRIALTLGRRPSRSVARPLESLRMRARFDLAVTLTRAGSGLTMTRQPIAIDHTPWRIQGLVGTSLYRSARAAGAPAKVVESYIKALATRLSVGRDVDAADTFDIILERKRAATGETQTGGILFAGLDQGRKRVQLMRWGRGKEWFDAAGQTERRGTMALPVAGRVTSNFGMRNHPLLGFLRMHKGLDIGAPHGTPIHAAMDGIVASAGRNAGYGNFVKLTHSGGLASGYGHLSRIAVASGTRVRAGQVIGYVGSTGMSTGPHLHWEVWRHGASVNPRSIAFAQVGQLSGSALRAFKAKVAGLLAVKPGA